MRWSFGWSVHGSRRRAKRGIHDAEVRHLIRTGTLRRTAEENVWLSENRYLRVVYRIEPCNIYLITPMYQRRP